eukprot:5152113-Amphidinium_carterae.1
MPCQSNVVTDRFKELLKIGCGVNAARWVGSKINRHQSNARKIGETLYLRFVKARKCDTKRKFRLPKVKERSA